MVATTTLSEKVGVKAACSALGLPRATYYRHRHPTPRDEQERPKPPLALTAQERQAVLEHLHSRRFVDLSPRQIWATLLDEEQQHLCSVRTMYRILEAEGEVRERRNQLRRPVYAKPDWAGIRKEAGLEGVRVHDLRHHADIGIRGTRSPASASVWAFRSSRSGSFSATPRSPPRSATPTSPTIPSGRRTSGSAITSGR